jgi:hypothetical protein
VGNIVEGRKAIFDEPDSIGDMPDSMITAKKISGRIESNWNDYVKTG